MLLIVMYLKHYTNDHTVIPFLHLKHVCINFLHLNYGFSKNSLTMMELEIIFFKILFLYFQKSFWTRTTPFVYKSTFWNLRNFNAECLCWRKTWWGLLTVLFINTLIKIIILIIEINSSNKTAVLRERSWYCSSLKYFVKWIRYTMTNGMYFSRSMQLNLYNLSAYHLMDKYASYWKVSSVLFINLISFCGDCGSHQFLEPRTRCDISCCLQKTSTKVKSWLHPGKPLKVNVFTKSFNSKGCFCLIFG